MIRKLELENFQTFSSLQSARLAPLTLIFGPNAAGKSSIGRAIRFIAQNLNTSGGLKFNDSLVSMKAFQNMVHRNDLSSTVGINFECDGPTAEDLTTGEKFSSEGKERVYAARGLRNRVPILRTELTFGITPSLDSRLEKCRYSASHVVEGKEVQEYSFGFVSERDANGEWKAGLTPDLEAGESFGPLESLAFPTRIKGTGKRSRKLSFRSLISLLGIYESLPGSTEAAIDKGRIEADLRNTKKLVEQIRGGYGFEVDESSLSLAFSGEGYWSLDEEEESDRIRLEMSELLASRLTELLSRHLNGFPVAADIEYVGPIRAIPQDISATPLVEKKNWGALNKALLLLTDGRFSLDMGKFKTEKIELNAFANLVQDHRSETLVSFSDVGVGLSQVIPVLVSAYKTSWKLLVVEQPELHLHPRLQGDLADVLIQSSGITQSNDENRPSKQLIIETHSENLILRVQRRIREGTLRSSDVCILYVDYPTDSGSTIREIRLSDVGQVVDTWPESFVDIRLDDLLGDIT